MSSVGTLTSTFGDSASKAFETSSDNTGGSVLYSRRPRCSIVIGSNGIVNFGRVIIPFFYIRQTGLNAWYCWPMNLLPTQSFAKQLFLEQFIEVVTVTTS